MGTKLPLRKGPIFYGKFNIMNMLLMLTNFVNIITILIYV